MPVRAALAPLLALDQEIAHRVAALPVSPVDTTLRALTTAANGGTLWFGLAAGLASRGANGRRSALRGVASLGLAAAVTHYGVKPRCRRVRPQVTTAVTGRTLARRPRSSSFPSGHAASSVAFATAVALSSRRAGRVALPLAALVAYSRVHVGVHWTSDVVAGSVLGAGVARGVAALL